MPEEKKPKICPLKMAGSFSMPAEIEIPEDAPCLECTPRCAWYDESEDIEGGCVMVAIAEHLKEIWSRMPQV